MGYNFRACDREQMYLMPASMREWLPEGHLAWFVLDVVEEMDLSAFYRGYRADGWGQAANLRRLSLMGNEISDLGPLAGLANLTGLELWRNEISNLEPLSELTELRYLQLSFNRISGISPIVSNSKA